MFSFLTLENRYHLKGTLELVQAAHVGCGESGEDIDAIFIKTGKEGRRFIPGSSLRGALRSFSERVIYTLQPAFSCLLTPETSDTCPTCNKNQEEAFNKIAEAGEKSNKTIEAEQLKFLQDNLCLPCQVFGSTLMSSRVKIADLLPLNNGKPKGQKRCGVAIDRDTEAARPGLLYNYEVVEAGEKFQLDIWAENMTESHWGALSLGLLELMAGNFWVGGKSAAGMGQCKLTEDSLHLEYFSGMQELKRYLENNAFPGQKKKHEVKAFLQQQVKFLMGYLNSPTTGGAEVCSKP